MKKLLSTFALIALVMPTFAAANTIQIYPSIENAHGGTKFANDITVCWEVNGSRSCDTGVPSFVAEIGSTYNVFPTPPAGYSYSTHGSCDGTVAGDEASMICFVDYADGAPFVEAIAPIPAPAPAPQPQVSGIVDVPTVVLPTSVIPVAGDVAVMTEAEQIASLQAQILELYKILIALLTQRLAVLGK